jgi:hypothetical protein
MKLNVLLAVAALTGATALSAQTVQKLDDEKYALSVQDLSMTVDAAHGGKILSFKLGEQEILAQNPAAAPQPAPQGEGQPRRRFFNPNSYGSTFWTSPQAEWNWPPVPEYDSLPYGALVTKGPFMLDGRIALPALRLIGQTSKYGYQVTKFITMDPTDGAIVITYSKSVLDNLEIHFNQSLLLNILVIRYNNRDNICRHACQGKEKEQAK